MTAPVGEGPHGPDASSPRPRGLLSAAYRGLVVGLLAIVTCSAFEAMAVTTAMPVVAADLGGQRAYGLAFSLFLTASLAATAAAGPWCDRAGPRPSLLVGLVLMTGGLLLAGGAWDFGVFTLGRMVSGAGTGFMIVPLYVIIGQALPSALQPVLFSWFSAAWVLPSLVGPYISGLLAQHASWRWVFFGVAPIVIVAVVLVWPRVRGLGAPEETSLAAGEGRRRALLGVVLAAGVAAAQWAAQSWTDPGARATVPPALLAAVVLCGVAAVAAAAPRLMPRGVARVARGLPAVMVVRGLLTLAFFGAEAFIPLMLVDAYGLEPSVAGLALTGGALGWTVGSFVQARGWLGKPTFLVLGSVVLTVGLGSIAGVVAATAAPWLLAVAWFLAGCGMGLATTTTSVLVLDLSEAADRGRNSASLQMADMLGGVMGTAGAGTLYSLLLTPEAVPGPGVFALLAAALTLSAFLSAFAGARSAVPSAVASAADEDLA
ncbi:MFS transporter [Sinomonas atrocyanea]|uniref:MFS transporter n=1 Tax=Sinomonas atrocyanea TaxID=37927 RepID=UPI00277EBA7E|nr:MFS transporter [Sinomonas atrocyanea]MDQ0258284.1 MFS family permease [Sinomonas atrocyanea]MDR6620551.1 MFS family permease [Sinomonas atrocyanea]